MLPIIPHFISGQRVTAGQQALPVYNPALGAPIRQIHTADSDTILQAIASAREAFKTWSKTPPIKRARLLFDYRALIQQHENELIELDQHRTRQNPRRCSRFIDPGLGSDRVCLWHPQFTER